MAFAALITWLLTVLGGGYMLVVWIVRGGLRRSDSSYLPPALVFGHIAYAAAGLVVWILYLVAYRHVALAWSAFVLLLPVATMGLIMLLRWIPTYRARIAASRRSTGEPANVPAVAERHFPIAVVVEHGTLAVVTVVLVLLTALGVGSG